jgi:small conductance mechanosensitive channel
MDVNFDYSVLLPFVWNVIGALLLLTITVIVAGWARRATRAAVERSDFDPTLGAFFASLARYTVLILGGLAVLGMFDISVASFAAILAAAGFAVGLALQGTLSHFAAGVMLLIFRPFGVGDRVSAADTTGTVVEVGLFATLFDTPDNRRIIVPNGALFGSTIENQTHHDTRRVDVSVGTAYDADLATTRAVLTSVAESVEGGFSAPAPQVYLSELGASSIDWAVRVWTNTGDYWDVSERLTTQIKQALDAEGIGIPYPQMDVHLDDLTPSNGEPTASGHGKGASLPSA